ncbi:hypothetical protein KC339_g77 [Hortaea werneckii]|nr:hypothetical protein KC339_g77 [Hortaea werneckii]
MTAALADVDKLISSALAAIWGSLAASSNTHDGKAAVRGTRAPRRVGVFKVYQDETDSLQQSVEGSSGQPISEQMKVNQRRNSLSGCFGPDLRMTPLPISTMDSRASESASVAFCFWWRPWKATSVMSVDMKDPYIVLCESTPKKSKRRFSELHETLSIICREIAIVKRPTCQPTQLHPLKRCASAWISRSSRGRLRGKKLDRPALLSAFWIRYTNVSATCFTISTRIISPSFQHGRHNACVHVGIMLRAIHSRPVRPSMPSKDGQASSPLRPDVISDCLTLPSSTFPFGRTCTVHSRFTTRDGSVLPSLLVLVSRSEPPRLKSAPDAIERDAAGPWSPAGKLVGENSIPQVSSARSTKIASGSVSAMVGAGSLGAGVGGACRCWGQDRSARRNVLTFTVIRRRWRGNLEIRVGLCQE